MTEGFFALMDSVKKGTHRVAELSHLPQVSLSASAAPAVATQPARVWHQALGVAGASFLLRFVLGAVLPLDPDEAYYWEWSRHLAPGYFDHPPVVALLARLGTAALGATPLGVRLFSLLAGLGGSLTLLVLARRHGGDRGARRAALALACVPLLTNWLVFATPDPAFFFAAAVTLLSVDGALRAAPRSSAALAWWSAAGASLGVALASKYIAVLLAPAVLLAFLRRDLRTRLAEPGPYVATAIALALFAPVLLWNARNDWVSFRFQLEHGLGTPSGPAGGREISFLAGQVGVVTPLLFALLTAAAVRALRHGADGRRYVLGMVAFVNFACFGLSAMRRRVEPNWPLMAYPPAIVLLAGIRPTARSRKWLGAALALGGASVLLIGAHTLTPILPLAPGVDPFRRGHGWSVVAAHADSARASGSGRAWVAANRYQVASLLAFNLPGHPFVPALSIAGRASQYGLWPGVPDRAAVGDDLMLVTDEVDGDAGSVRRLEPYFWRVRLRDVLEPSGAMPELPRMRIWMLEGWNGSWPRVEAEP